VLRGQNLQPIWARLHGLALRGMNFGDDDHATNGELWLLDRLAARLGPSPVVFDVGANAGRYSEAVLERMPTALLHSFEPSTEAFGKLEAAIGHRAATCQLALGSEDVERPFYADYSGSELGSLIRRDLHRHGRIVKEIETVVVRRLETVCAELAIDRIDFLKVDTEGNDLAVLEGAGSMLGDRIEVIQFEFGGTAIDSHENLRDFFDLLEPQYRIHRLLPRGLWPLDYSEASEVVVYANYVAVPASDIRLNP
jgi:FkbM family methyltransferase